MFGKDYNSGKNVQESWALAGADSFHAAVWTFGPHFQIIIIIIIVIRAGNTARFQLIELIYYAAIRIEKVGWY